MLIIDGRSSKPIYQQIIDGIKEKIIQGALEPGDRLPSVRELAKVLLTNPNTVARAYRDLEREKVIETIRGKGTFISSVYKPQFNNEILERIKENMKKIVIEAHYIGIDKERLANLLVEVYDSLTSDK